MTTIATPHALDQYAPGGAHQIPEEASPVTTETVTEHALVDHDEAFALNTFAVKRARGLTAGLQRIIGDGDQGRRHLLAH